MLKVSARDVNSVTCVLAKKKRYRTIKVKSNKREYTLGSDD